MKVEFPGCPRVNTALRRSATRENTRGSGKGAPRASLRATYSLLCNLNLLRPEFPLYPPSRDRLRNPPISLARATRPSVSEASTRASAASPEAEARPG